MARSFSPREALTRSLLMWGIAVVVAAGAMGTGCRRSGSINESAATAASSVNWPFRRKYESNVEVVLKLSTRVRDREAEHPPEQPSTVAADESGERSDVHPPPERSTTES